MSTRWCFGLIGVKEPSNPSQKEEIASYKKKKANKKKASKKIFSQSSGNPCKNKYFESYIAPSTQQFCTQKEAITVMEQEQAKHVIAVTIEEATIPYYEASEMEEYAAIRIQTAFRAYLARRAFRALKGLVRLQALFRGHRVRKQADITIKCMLSLVRVQAQIRAYRARMSKEYQVGEHHFTCKHAQQEPSPRKSMVVARQVAGPWRAARAGAISPVTGTAKVEPKDIPGEWSSQGNTQILEIHPTQQRIPKKLSEWCEKMSVETQTCSDSTEKSVQTAKVIQSILPCKDRWAEEAKSIVKLSTREDKHDLATMKSNHKHFNTTGSKSAFKSESGKVNQQLNEMEAELGFRSYMSPTQSAKAKVRCRSAPKLRPSSSDKSSNYTAKRLSVSSPDKAIYPAITRPSGGFS